MLQAIFYFSCNYPTMVDAIFRRVLIGGSSLKVGDAILK
jgi:hypothetical protein